MHESLTIKYETSATDGFDLGVLGDSLSGMSQLMKELCDMTGIDGNVAVKTSKITKSSVKIHAFIDVVLTAQNLPFSNIKELYDFLQVVNPEMLEHAQAFFSDIQGVHRDLNEYFVKNPFDGMVLTMIPAFLVAMLRWSPLQKTALTLSDEKLGRISKRKAKRLNRLVNNGKYKRVLEPIVNGEIPTITVATTGSSKKEAILSRSNLEGYLPEDSRILPQLENGSEHEFIGEIVGLQSTKGETLKIKVKNIDPHYSLIMCHPKDGIGTEDFTDFYKKEITFTAEVVRKSMFEKPELVLKRASLNQTLLL